MSPVPARVPGKGSDLQGWTKYPKVSIPTLGGFGVLYLLFYVCIIFNFIIFIILFLFIPRLAQRITHTDKGKGNKGKGREKGKEG